MRNFENYSYQILLQKVQIIKGNNYCFLKHLCYHTFSNVAFNNKFVKVTKYKVRIYLFEKLLKRLHYKINGNVRNDETRKYKIRKIKFPSH